MKVLQLIQKPQLRGAEMFACQLSNHLQQESNTVVKVVAIYSGDKDLPFEGSVLRLNRLKSKRFYDFKGWKKLALLIKTEKIDIVQANASDTLKFAVFSKFFFRWKCPIIFRNANKMGDFITSKPKYLLNKFFVDRVNYVVSVSRLCELDFKSTFNYSPTNISTIPIGVEEWSLPDSPPEDLQDIFKNKVLVSVGSLVPEKNHEALIRIFDGVASQQDDLHLLIVGDGLLRTKLEQQVASLKCRDRVTFVGYRDDVLQILKFANAFLMPSLIEGLPGVILEAMYCKTPVIANNVGGVSEVVNERTGWLIEKGDESGFAAAIFEVLKGDSQLHSKIDSAFEHVKTNYLNSKLALQFKEVYSSELTKTFEGRV